MELSNLQHLRKNRIFVSFGVVAAAIVIVVLLSRLLAPHPVNVSGKWKVTYGKMSEVDIYVLHMDSDDSLTGSAYSTSDPNSPVSLTGSIDRHGHIKLVNQQFGMEAIADGQMKGQNEFAGHFDAPGEPDQTFNAKRIK